MSFANPVVGPAITISTATPGPVVVDLEGFTLSGNSGNTGVVIGAFAGGSNLYPITVRNGTLNGFEFGVQVQGANFAVMTNITLEGLTVNEGNAAGNAVGIVWIAVSNSTIRDCTFRGGDFGIEDVSSKRTIKLETQRAAQWLA